VGYSIDLDNQLSVQSDEINDISIDGVLATEFPACQPPIAQRLPELCFCTGLR